jgi:alkylation response protein AidB-like acyl-CoA dehydrogenase
MFNLQLSAEQLEIRDTVRDFVTGEVKPVTLKSDRLDRCDRTLPLEVLDKASQMGLRTLSVSEDNGGAGADTLTSVIVAEELATGDADVAATLTETARLGHILFDRLMNDEQRERFLAPFLEDDRYHLAFADREPDSEAELGVHYHRPQGGPASFKTAAVRAGNREWVLNGAKAAVANGPVAKLFAVQVTTDPASGRNGVSTILVPRDTPGLTVRETQGGLAWHHGGQADLIFEDCRVPAENLLGPEGAGHGQIERDGPHFPAMNLGVGRAAYEAALDYAQMRVQGGRRIIEHQAIGAKLADIAIKLEIARNTIWHVAWTADHPEAVADRSVSALPLQDIARIFTSETVHEIAKDSAEVFGAMGVMRDMPLQKYVGDALIFLHSGSGNAEARLRIAEALVGYQRPAGNA